VTRWIVVGGGTAGCVVAARLAERAEDRGDTVVLLEAGPAHPASTPDDGDVGPFLVDRARVAQVDVVPAAGRPREPYVQGFGLGGASLVNAGMVTGSPAGFVHRLPLAPAAPVGVLGAALLAADPAAATVLLARRGGRRVTVAEAYLDPLAGDASLTVRTEAPVAKIVLDGTRAVGVELVGGEQFDAERVVVCAGAIGTPALLLRSGVAAPGVGQGLQDHVGVSVAVALPAGSVDPAAPAVAVTAEHRDRQVVAMEPTAATAGLGALIAGLMAVRSTGAVTLPDPAGPPHVDFGRLTDPADRRGLRAVADDLAELLARPALRDLVTEVYADDQGTRFDEVLSGGRAALAEWAWHAPSPYFHAAASCRIGTVTDDLGRVHGTTGLAVCDASLFPGVPRANPFLAVIDLAERLSSAWIERRW
jgi:choline dehydrogenase-like flavoprotein